MLRLDWLMVYGSQFNETFFPRRANWLYKRWSLKNLHPHRGGLYRGLFCSPWGCCWEGWNNDLEVKTFKDQARLGRNYHEAWNGKDPSKIH